MHYGAAKDHPGLVLMTTLGTGIGTAIVYRGVLIPNSELGHLEIDGHDAETRAAASVKEREGLSYKEWIPRLQRYYERLEALLWPDMIVIGGGVSKNSDKFIPKLKLNAEVVPAKLLNTAGIVGAAWLAADRQIHPDAQVRRQQQLDPADARAIAGVSDMCRKPTYTSCGLHRLQRVQTASNLRLGLSGGSSTASPMPGAACGRYMRSKGSIPSMVSPAASTRFVARHSASRESRTAPEDCSTGHCS